MIGEIVSHYRITGKVGEGGMGVIYKAEDTKLKRTVALKFLPGKLIRYPEARKRFEREARAAAALNNPHIVTIHDIIEDKDRLYIVMEYVYGQTLKEKIQSSGLHCQTPSPNPLQLPEHDPTKTKKIKTPAVRSIPMEKEEIITAAMQVCEGLKAAHQAGIIHRDIKPQNILINNKGIVKILDFGVAKLTKDTNITKESVALGTPHYMSPEHLTGKGVDRRSDIWSLGVVLYEMLTAKLPFYRGNLQATQNAVLNEDPAPLPGWNDHTSRELEKIVLKCLHKDPGERYQSVEPLLTELKALKYPSKKDSRKVKLNKKTGVKKETERRHATVISAEISGYNELLETMDPEEVAPFMSDLMDSLATIAVKYGGRFDKITGSSFTVLLGVPSAIENALKKAINTAIEMRSQMAHVNKTKNPGISLELCIGINSGIVVAGLMGKEDEKYSVFGETVAFAHRLKEMAAKEAAGKIYVGPLTYRYTKDEFEYIELKPVTLRGKNRSFAIYELLSLQEKIGRARLGVERMISSEMVGRDEELDKLQFHLFKVINGEGSVVNVVGEAGIGKSRLITELKKAEACKKVTHLEGRALSIGKNLSFHPLIDTIKNWAGIKEDDSTSEAYHKLEQTITGIDPTGWEEIFPFIATLMGMKLGNSFARRMEEIEGEALEKIIKKSFRELIIKTAEQQPVVFIIEDLHWADLTSIELLESLFRLAENNRILFVNVFRPNYPETGDRLLNTITQRCRGFHKEIYLESLDRNQSEQLISGLLKIQGVPSNISEPITARAGGNPFFIEEVMRSFIDDGVVELKNGKFKVTEKIESVIIPETINDVLMGRIDKLEEATRSLLKVASVIGRNFFYKILAEVGKNIEDIDDRLEILKEVQLIRERRRIGELEYLFKHALVQEAVYESILLKKRKELHVKVAEAIESVFEDRLHEFCGMLAFHYHLGENLEKAETYLLKAGEEALKAAAASEALHYYREALNLYLKKHGNAGDPGTLANLEKNIATAFYNKGYMTEAILHFDKVMKLWGEDPPKNKVNVFFHLAADFFSIIKRIYFPIRQSKKKPGPDIDEIVDVTFKRSTALVTVDNYRMFMDSIGLLRKLNAFDVSKVTKGISAYIHGGTLFSFSGRSFKISNKLQEYSRANMQPGDRKAAIDYKFSRILYRTLSGNWAEGTGEPGFEDEIIHDSLQMGELWSAIVYLVWTGILQLEKGNFGLVRRCVDRLREIGEVYDHDFARSRRSLLLTRLLLKCRKLPEAFQEVEAGISSSHAGEDLDLLNFTGLKANIQILRGDLAGAAKSLTRAKEIVLKEKGIAPWHVSSFHLSRFLFDIHHLEKAVQSGDKLEIKGAGKRAHASGKIAVKTARKYAPNRTETYRLLGVYYWLLGKRKRSLTWFKKSLRVGVKLGARLELARTCMEIVKRLLERKGKSRKSIQVHIGRYLGKALELFRKMGLKEDLEELDNIVRRAKSRNLISRYTRMF